MRRHRPSTATIAMLIGVGLLFVACSTDDPVATTSPTIAPSTEAEPPTTELDDATAASSAPSTTAPPSTTAATDASTPTTSAARSLTPLALDPTGFVASIEQLDDIVLSRVVGSSWRDGCPVALDRLRYVEVTHHTDDGSMAIGELIVNAAVADDIVAAFAILFGSGFPVESMRLVDDFGADDLRSMQANNTSAFNCRFVTGTTGWSWHAYGRAIDINPLVNPYVTDAGIDPPEGAAFADRSQQSTGMIQPDDAVTTAFADLGWEWGGSWHAAPDYQHFVRSGG